MNTIEFVKDVLEILRDMEDVYDVICNSDADAVVVRMKDRRPIENRLNNAFDKGYEIGIQEVLDKIRAEMQKLRNCSCSCSDGIIDDVEEIIDKYMAERSEKE